jgi:hypothetical protein
MSESAETTLKVERLPVRLVVAGAVLLAICLAGGFADKAEFFRSYLIAFLFWGHFRRFHFFNDSFFRLNWFPCRPHDDTCNRERERRVQQIWNHSV